MTPEPDQKTWRPGTGPGHGSNPIHARRRNNQRFLECAFRAAVAMKRLIPALALTLAGVGCVPYAYHDADYGRVYPGYDYYYPGAIAYPVYDGAYPTYHDWHRDDRHRDGDRWQYDHRWGDRDRGPDHRDFDHRETGYDRDRRRDRDHWHPSPDR